MIRQKKAIHWQYNMLQDKIKQHKTIQGNPRKDNIIQYRAI